MWNQIFLGSYMSLFVAIPFAYFFTESEGFAGSRKVTFIILNNIFTDCIVLTIVNATTGLLSITWSVIY